MSERQRHTPHTGSRDHADDADREDRIEQLLLAGLDHYFAGQYEQAIDIWTRVAFLKRRNSRAKAYIDRARGLVAERQREAEALVHEGVAAYEAGDLTSSRLLLTRAVDRGAQSDTALLFLDRLRRVETLSSGETPTPSARRSEAPRQAPASRSGSWIVTLGASVLLAGAILIGARPIVSILSDVSVVGPAPAAAPLEALPTARPSDRVLDRAQALRRQGRLREALRALSVIDVADPARAASDELRAQLQREIFASSPSTGAAVSDATGTVTSAATAVATAPEESR